MVAATKPAHYIFSFSIIKAECQKNEKSWDALAQTDNAICCRIFIFSLQLLVGQEEKEPKEIVCFARNCMLFVKLYMYISFYYGCKEQ